jgi:hypothetical protein
MREIISFSMLLQIGYYKSYPLKKNLVPEICKKKGINKDWFVIQLLVL